MRLISIVLLTLLSFGCTKPKEAIQQRAKVDWKAQFFKKYSIEMNKYLNEYERHVIRNYIRRNNLQGKIAPEGFFTQNLKKTNLKPISQKSAVTLTGFISSIDGVVLYQYNREQPLRITMNANNDFIGLHLALPNKREGENWLFIFPSYLAYGRMGDGKNVGSNSILIANLHIVKVD